MSPNELKKLLETRPFKPFTVYLPQGTGFEVPHPEFAWLTPTGRTLIVGKASEDGVDMLEVPLITRVQVSPTPTP